MSGDLHLIANVLNLLWNNGSDFMGDDLETYGVSCRCLDRQFKIKLMRLYGLATAKLSCLVGEL